jgi:signal transduction histidine kinase
VSDKRTLLVVDDDAETLGYLETVLRSAGYEIVTAADVPAARRALDCRRFDMVLTDLSLPGGSGLDVLEAARRADPVTVGIVLSGHGTVDSALEAMRQGAYDYLVKPCSPDILLAAVKRALEYYDLKQTLIAKTAQLEKLEGQLHDKSRLIQNVSHELKNPLSVVFGYSSFLLNASKQSPQELKRGLQSIHNNAERLSHLLEELLESSRLAGRKMNLERRPLAVAEALQEALENHRLEAGKRGIVFSLDSKEAGDVRVDADPQRVQQILANLLGNALKFTLAGGAVVLSARPSGGFVEFSVKDTGIGIPETDIPRLFERFYQAENTPRGQQGLGLGLEIAKGLVELHGGAIRAQSVPGKGTTISFTLPLAARALEICQIGS